MNRRHANQRGFSLAELMITALIFGVGLLGLAALQVSTLRNNSGGRNRVTAAGLAEGCLGAIQAEGSLSWSFAAGVMGTGVTYPITRAYTGANTQNGTFGTFDVNGQPVAAGTDTQVFQVAWTRMGDTAATPKNPINGMYMNEFVVTVSWQDQAIDGSGQALAPTTLSLSRLVRY